ncbi:hypothetical protein FLCU109888_00590 [Flavobacterium cucumis]|uniref:Lipoprotein n=1 Tax=Flavobacterium cucumis TaxID=416016 RepID=A0A1M7ZTU5_9FLAO|nr:hypothetical protein [Flavobacterium cucumis]SHO72319.1 hypothetical protein SAMN05443547_0650 [Flavobacterium cucumis]
MKHYISILFLILVTSCSSQDVIIKESAIEASYQSWVAGIRGGGSGINFYIDLKSELPPNIELKKVIFRGYEVTFENQDELHLIARIKTEGNQQKSEEDDTQIYTSPKNALILADKEAILVFSKNGKEYQQKITNVIEKPSLEYPSAKPKF